MTTSPSDQPPFAASVASATGADTSFENGTLKAVVGKDRWVEALTAARDELGLVFFSWLSAIDWTNDDKTGDGPAEEVEERYEVMAAVSDLTEGNLVVFSTTVDKEAPSIASLTDVFAGANWHEREAHEMFGIDFEGHPDMAHLYLPDEFEGHPLRKDYPLLSREVKPWPGTVDVEAMPSTENPEA